jgi:AcrR family transcriptional regulator
MSTTRDGLLTAAAVVFDRDGYVRATIDDVCDHAGVTKGALYGHFSSKKALAIAVLDRQAQEWARRRDDLQRAHHSPLQVLVDLGHVMSRDRLIGQWTWTIRDLLRAAQRKGDLRPDVDVDGCAEGIVATLVGVHLMSLVVDDPDAMARLWRNWLPAVARPEVLRTLRTDPPRGRGR